MSYIYLGCPYSHHSAAVRALRFQMVNEFAARLMSQGQRIFSPISHTHPIAAYLDDAFLMDHDFWMHQDLNILSLAEKLLVLRLPGWESSRGLKTEIEHATAHNIPVEYADYAPHHP